MDLRAKPPSANPCVYLEFCKTGVLIYFESITDRDTIHKFCLLANSCEMREVFNQGLSSTIEKLYTDLFVTTVVLRDGANFMRKMFS
jgi:hypothetical protein